MVDALGIAGSMAGGIIEYLAEGAWTKRLHPGWAAQSGLRAALLGRQGFLGPRTVFEGVHGLFHGFAHTATGNYDALIGDFGAHWVTQTLAFKPYPCGTMTHPYIDCARRLAARGIKAEEIQELVCEVGEGTVHRLWEPLAAKQRPTNGYAGKFSTPYCIAHAFVRGQVGLDAFADDAVKEPRVLALASKVRYQIDPKTLIPTTSPVMSARCLPMGVWSRSASRTCAAARTNRSPAATSRRNSFSMRVTADGMRRARSGRWGCCGPSMTARSIFHRCAGKSAVPIDACSAASLAIEFTEDTNS